MSKSIELRNQRAAIVAQSRQMLDAADTDKRELSSEENEKYNKMMADVDSLAKEISKVEKREQVDALEAESRVIERKSKPTVNTRSGEPEASWYTDALRAWCLRGTERQRIDSDTVARAAMCGVDLNSNEINLRSLTKSANTVPVGFASQFEKKLQYYSPFRDYATVLQTETGQDIDFPTGDDIAQKAVIVAEEATVQSSSDPSFSKITLKMWKWSTKTLKVSQELLDDNAINLETLLADMFGERMARGQNEQFILGDGTTEPQGIAVFCSAGANLASGNAMDTDKLIDVYYSVNPAYRNAPNAGWICHDDSIASVRKLKDDIGNYVWQPGLQLGEPDKILGRRVVTDPNMTSILSPGSNSPLFIFGDLKKYLIRDVANSTRLRRLNELYADTDQVGFVLLRRTDGRVIGHSGCFKSLNSL